jgi:hypothetical protein
VFSYGKCGMHFSIFFCSLVVILFLIFVVGLCLKSIFDQSAEHPNPGKRYKGTRRVAFLPRNREGEEVLTLLKTAWERRLLFRVGTSVTTGQSDVVTWAGVHHKTSTWGGATNFGYVSNSNFSQSVKGVSMVGAVLASVRTGCARQGWQDLLKSINNRKSDFPSKQKLEIRGFREDWVETTFSALNQSVLDTSLDMEIICRM